MDDNFKEFFNHLKSSTKNPEEMFLVNPITLSPQVFINRVSTNKEKIENPSSILITDIGLKPKD